MCLAWNGLRNLAALTFRRGGGFCLRSEKAVRPIAPLIPSREGAEPIFNFSGGGGQAIAKLGLSAKPAKLKSARLDAAHLG